MSDEEYNGWTNYETWAAYTWLSSDEEIYNAIRHVVREQSGEVESIIKAFVEDLRDSANALNALEELKAMFEDIGSLWRIDWHELIEAFKDYC